MLGAIIGDIAGSRYEFNPTNDYHFEMFSKEAGYTDDTICTCAIADALLNRQDYGDALHEWCRKYPNPKGGYGGRFALWVHSDTPQPYGSYGNGSAMRISPVGFTARSVEEAKKLSATVTGVSHNHPEGLKGAEATAVAIVMARQGKTKKQIKTAMEEYYDLSMSVDEYRTSWKGHGREICQIAVPQALVCFLEGDDYEDVIRNCISIGGDSDTIAAIGGGIAEAFFGVPEEYAEKAKTMLDPRLLSVYNDFQQWLEQRS